MNRDQIMPIHPEEHGRSATCRREEYRPRRPRIPNRRRNIAASIPTIAGRWGMHHVVGFRPPIPIAGIDRKG